VGVGNYTLYIYENTSKLKMTPLSSSVNGFMGKTDTVEEKKAWDYQPVHNLWFLVWSEIGIFGLLFFVAILFYILKFNIQHSTFNIHFLLLIAIIMLGLFDHYFWSLYFGVMVWWLVLGLTLKTGRNKV